MDRCYNLLDPRVGEVSVFDSSQGGRVRLRGLNRVRFSLEIFRSSAVVNPRFFQPKIPKIHILCMGEAVGLGFSMCLVSLWLQNPRSFLF
jgi:hypothetical protein